MQKERCVVHFNHCVNMSFLLRTGFLGPIIAFLTPVDFLLIFLIFCLLVCGRLTLATRVQQCS